MSRHLFHFFVSLEFGFYDPDGPELLMTYLELRDDYRSSNLLQFVQKIRMPIKRF